MNDTDKIQAGRELDELVGKKVMGCHVVKRKKGTFDLIIPGGINSIDWVEEVGAWSGMPRYSTDIAAAWQVAEKVSLFANCRHLHEYREQIGKGAESRLSDWMWVVEEVFQPVGENTILARGETAPLAICRAALLVAAELKRAEEANAGVTNP